MALTEEQLKKLPPKAQAFWRKAFEHVRTSGQDWFRVERGTAEYKAWERYFAVQGWNPFAIKQIELGRIKEMTMPTQWPEWFDLQAKPARLISSIYQDS